MRGQKFTGLLVAAFNVFIEFADFDAVLPPAANFDRAQFLVAHEGVGLGCGDVKDLGDFGERQEASFHA